MSNFENSSYSNWQEDEENEYLKNERERYGNSENQELLAKNLERLSCIEKRFYSFVKKLEEYCKIDAQKLITLSDIPSLLALESFETRMTIGEIARSFTNPERPTATNIRTIQLVKLQEEIPILVDMLHEHERITKTIEQYGKTITVNYKLKSFVANVVDVLSNLLTNYQNIIQEFEQSFVRNKGKLKTMDDKLHYFNQKYSELSNISELIRKLKEICSESKIIYT